MRGGGFSEVRRQSAGWRKWTWGGRFAFPWGARWVSGGARLQGETRTASQVGVEKDARGRIGEEGEFSGAGWEVGGVGGG